MQKLVSKEDKRVLTPELLVEKGFEDITPKWERDYWKEHFLDGYAIYRVWTGETPPMKIDMTHGLTNSNSAWNMHIDNAACSSIAFCEIDYAWQFNAMMEIFGSNFRI